MNWLHPCKSCGSFKLAIYQLAGKYYTISCENCVAGVTFLTKEQATEAWNTRV